MTRAHFSVLGLFLKGLLAGLGYLVGMVLSRALFTALHIHMVNFEPPGTDPHAGPRLFGPVCLLLGLALVPLARRTGGSRLLRGLALAFLIFICMGVTSVMESRIFLTIFAHGGALSATFIVVLPALLCGLVLSYFLALEQPEISVAQKCRAFFAAHSPISWIARFVLAILAFGVVYFLFGMMVAPFVVPFYRAGALGLTLPPSSVILPVLFIRSALFLLACLPFLILWTGSRASLILSLGLAHWFLSGLFGMLLVFYWPTVMRVGHGLEIGADSFTYAAVLVFLFLPRRRENSVPAPAHAAPMFPS